MQPINFNRNATWNGIVKPIIATDDLTSGVIGTRQVATYNRIKQGDPLAAFTMPKRVIQSRPTTAQIDAGSVAPFGNPTASKQTWSLQDHLIFSRMHAEVFTDDVGNTTENPRNMGGQIEDALLSAILDQYKMPIQNDLFGHAFWSATNFDPATDYTGTHDFEAKTITSYQKNEGFMQLLKDALDAAAFSNYKTTSGTGGIDVDGATLTTDNANALAAKLLSNASRKLRAYGGRMPIEYKPFLALSNNFYFRLRAYVAATYSGVDAGYLLFAEGTDGRRTEIGYTYEGHAVYNYGSIFDEYWATTNPASEFNHMGLFMTPENLALGVNIQSPPTIANGQAGLQIYKRPEPEFGGATDLSIYLQTDYLINDTSMFSSIGLEQVDNS